MVRHRHAIPERFFKWMKSKQHKKINPCNLPPPIKIRVIRAIRGSKKNP